MKVKVTVEKEKIVLQTGGIVRRMTVAEAKEIIKKLGDGVFSITRRGLEHKIVREGTI